MEVTGLESSLVPDEGSCQALFSSVLSAAKECFNGTVFWDLLIFSCCRKWCKLFERQGGSTEILSSVFLWYSSNQKTTTHKNFHTPILHSITDVFLTDINYVFYFFLDAVDCITSDSNDWLSIYEPKKKRNVTEEIHTSHTSLYQHECEYMMTAFSFVVNCP